MSRLRGSYDSPILQLDRNVDDLTCPPPPPSVQRSSTETQRWKARHRGLLRRAQTLPSNERIAVLCAVALLVAVVPWVVVRRWVHCSIRTAPEVFCQYAWGFVTLCRGAGLVGLILTLVVLLWKWYWVARLRVDLAHLDPEQRRLLGLPTDMSHVSRASPTDIDGDIDMGGSSGYHTPAPAARTGSGRGQASAGKSSASRPWSHAASSLGSAARSDGAGMGVGAGAGAGGPGAPGGLTPGAGLGMGLAGAGGGVNDMGMYGAAAANAGVFGANSSSSFPAMSYMYQSSNPTRLRRLRGRQLGLEGRSSAIQDKRQLRAFLRERSARAQVMGTGQSTADAGRGGADSRGMSPGFGVVPYGGGGSGAASASLVGSSGGGFQSGGSMFYEYAPGFSYDTSARSSSVPGVGWDNLHQAEQLMAELSLSTEQVHAFAENLRRFMAKYLQDLFKKLDWNIGQLVKQGFHRDFLLGDELMGSVPNNPLHGKMRLNEMIHRLANEVTRYNARTPSGETVQLWKQRAELEEFFNMRRGGDPAYVMHRLRVLCRDGYLGRFNWDGGGTWRGRKWSAERPCDAELLLHAFTTMMDRRLKSYMSSEVQPFRNRYCHDGPSRPPKAKLARKHPILQFVSSQPPHACVFAGGKPRPIVEGRENVFQAIIVFLYYVKNEENDRLGSVDVRDLTRQVLTVQPGYYDALHFIRQD